MFTLEGLSNSWIPAVSAGLSAALVLLTGYLLFELWRKQREPLYIVSAFLTLFATLILYNLPYRYTWGWVISAVFSLLAISLAVWLVVRAPAWRERIIVGLVSLSLIGVATPLIYWQLGRTQSSATLQERVRTVQRSLVDARKALNDKATSLSDQEALNDILTQGSTPLNVASFQRFLVENDLDYALLTNIDGTVLLRAHDPEVYGDLLTDSHPWALGALTGNYENGVGLTESDEPMLFATAPVRRNELQKGVLLIGQDFERLSTDIRADLPTSTALAIYSSRSTAIFAKNNPTAESFLGSYAAENEVRDLLQKNDTDHLHQFFLQQNAQQYRTVVLTSTTLYRDIPIAFAVLDTATAKQLSPLIIGVLVTAAWLFLLLLWHVSRELYLQGKKEES